MHKYKRIGLYAMYALGLFLILIFSGDKYDWMSDFDSSISPGAIEDSSGNRFIFIVLMLCVTLLIQLFFLITSKKLTGRLWAIFFMGVALAVFILAR
mgnify:CR=1